MNKILIILIALFCTVFVSFGQTAKQKLSCVGNSITIGYGLSSPTTQSYPAQLQVLLGTALWEVGNYGVSSRTMLKKGDKPYWNEAAYTNAKAFLPNQVMIELGTNDAKTTNWNPNGKEFVSNYKEMIQVFQRLSSRPEVWIGLIPPGQNIGWNIRFGYVKDSVNIRIKQIAIESGVGLIDLYDVLNGNSLSWYNSSVFQLDSIHPKTAGAALIAQKVKEMISMSKPQISYTNGKIAAPVAYGYQWYYNNIMLSNAEGGVLQEITPTKTGKYKVSLKINAGNESRIVSNELSVLSLTALDEKPETEFLKIYPNPTSDGLVKVEVPLDWKNFGVAVFDLSGRLCLEQKSNSNDVLLNMSKISPGDYFVKINHQNLSYSKKLIKAL